MPEAPALAVKRLLERTGIALSDIAVLKNHNPFAVNDVVFTKVTGHPWTNLNNNGCPLVWGHPQGPTLTRVLIEALGRICDQPWWRAAREARAELRAASELRAAAGLSAAAELRAASERTGEGA